MNPNVEKTISPRIAQKTAILQPNVPRHTLPTSKDAKFINPS